MHLMNKNHIGSSFTSFLKEDEIYEDVVATTIKRTFSSRIIAEIKVKDLTLTEFAKQLKTSRAQLNRILDPENTSISLRTMVKVAAALDLAVTINLHLDI